MTQKQIILRRLEEIEDWLAGFKLQSIDTSVGWIGSQGGRRCRELYEAGLIERKIEGKYVYYRAKEKKSQVIKIIGSRDKEVIRLKI